MKAPRATYRLQLHSRFGFKAAAAIAPYLARLGVSHVYTSPILKARAGSTHGYDIIAHDSLNLELGTADDFAAMVDAFRAAGLDTVLDFVPNHMGVSGADNPLWLDVLEWGVDSAYAGWFDIDWQPHRGYLHEKLLVPVLGDQYGIELDDGKLVLKIDEAAGELAVWAYDTHKLPLAPQTYGDVLGTEHVALERLGDEFAALHDWRPQVARRALELKTRLAATLRADPAVRSALVAAIGELNRCDSDGARRKLDALIRKQHWRAAHFRVAGDDINYRRFFNINDLAGLRVELPEVFEHVHRFVLELVESGRVGALRIDHIDGLLEPREYLRRLRGALEKLGKRDCYVVVEKILARGEALPDTWPVAGTTGYELANLALRLLLDPRGESALTRAYRDFTDERESFPGIVHDAKVQIMRNEMASELNVLARDAARIARQNPRTADFTHGLLRTALRELIACFPVYRTYVDADGLCTETDLHYLGEAVASARRVAPEIDGSVFAFLARLLSGKLVEHPRSGFSRVAVLKCAMKFQQLSGPVMAKGLEDTAFYRFNRLIALNEVGGDPMRLGSDAAEVHAELGERARAWPHSLSATATHDTKRGEDARARLAVLSELATEWDGEVREWRRLLRGEGAAPPPTANDEYYFYQSLLGAWPAELCGHEAPSDAALGALRERLELAMTKAVREAKRCTSWASPDERYESAVRALVASALAPRPDNAFLSRFLPYVRRVAALGVRNSLAQVALKLTAPGVPDIYQGADAWDFNLVDPDNRRPVDFRARDGLLARVERALGGDRPRELAHLLDSWQDGAIKLAITRVLLELRALHPAPFERGDYRPCEIAGPRAEEVFAFSRRHDADVVVTAVQRFPARGTFSPASPGTRVHVDGGSWRDAVTGRALSPAPAIEAAELFAVLPVAVLVRTGE